MVILTQFYIQPPYLKFVQELFTQVIESHNVKSLFVPTCDELFVSLALDTDFRITERLISFKIVV